MSESIFQQEFSVRWSDLDPNAHMRHSAYADLCAATRFHYLESIGFGAARFAELKIGPILFNENLSYKKEVRPNDKVKVDVRLAAYSDDGRKWKIRHHITRSQSGELCAVVEVYGAWFSVEKRRLAKPPQELMETMEQLARTEDFHILGKQNT